MAPAIHRVTVVGFHGTLLFVEHLKRGEENLHFMVEETHTLWLRKGELDADDTIDTRVLSISPENIKSSILIFLVSTFLKPRSS